MYLSGFCHFGLVSFMGFVTEPLHSRHVLFLHERAASSVLEPCSVSSACLVSCWSVVFRSRHSCLEFRFRVGVRTLASVFCLMWVCGVQFAQPRALLSTCVLWLHAVRALLAACIHVVSCGVWHAACVFHWLHAFMLSCLVAYEFSH